MSDERAIDRNDPFPKLTPGAITGVERIQGDGAAMRVEPGEAAHEAGAVVIHYAEGSLRVEELACGALRLQASVAGAEPADSFAIAGEPESVAVEVSREAGDSGDGGRAGGGRGDVRRAGGGGRGGGQPAAAGGGAGPLAGGNTGRHGDDGVDPGRPGAAAGVHIRGERFVVDVTGAGIFVAAADDGRALYSTAGAPFYYSRSRIGAAVRLDPSDRIYGLGERMGYLDKRGRRYINWNNDNPFIRETTDPLYQSIPMWLRVTPPGDDADRLSGGAGRGAPGGSSAPPGSRESAAVDRPDAPPATATGAPTAAGVFIDYPGACWLDADSSDENIFRMHHTEGAATIYIVPGPRIDDVVAQYTALTGRMPMPPKWALGFHQSRYSYTSAACAEEVAGEFRARDIPCDAVYLDIHYMDGYRVFTWDRDAFPDPPGMLDRLRDRGIRVVTIVDPGVKADPDYHVYRDGVRDDVFARRSTGEIYHGAVWPGTAAFPDFTCERTRTFWARGHEALLGAGVSGIWNDMNEPADFTGTDADRIGFGPPLDLMLDRDGDRRPLTAYHNAYANEMARATREAFAEFLPEERPFVLTRAGYAGIQRHAAVWNGDVDSSWHHLAQSIPMFLNMGLSGVPFLGTDIGGFQFNATAELYVRWLQYAVFTPYMRAHTALGTDDHEPWAFGKEAEEIARESINLRYRLLPYVYSVFREAAGSGRPVMRTLASAFPGDARAYGISDQFLFGPSLLVAPVLTPDQRRRPLYLPEGVWYELHSGERFEGPLELFADAPLSRIPVFVRAPAVIPMQRPVPHTGVEPAEIELHAFAGRPGETGVFELYDDDGVSHAAGEGAYRLLRLEVESGGVPRTGAPEAAPGEARTASPADSAAGTAVLRIETLHDEYEGGPRQLVVMSGGRQSDDRRLAEIALDELPRSVRI